VFKSLLKKAQGLISFNTINAGWYARNGYQRLYSILSGGAPAWSGETVSVDTAFNHSVVYACQKVISEPVGFIPSLVCQRKGKNKREATELPLYNLFRYSPNEEITAQSWIESSTSQCVMQGDSFSHIVRRSGGGTAISINPIAPELMHVDRDLSKRITYTIKLSGQSDKTYTLLPGKAHDILHIRGLGWNGLRGLSVIQMGRHSIGTAISAEKNIAGFYKNGGRLPYIIESEQKFKTPEDGKAWAEDWRQIYSDPHRAPVLQPGMKYKQIGISAEDSQLLGMRQYTISEICRWFGVSPHMVGDLSRATFSNIEQLAAEFVKFTLTTWLTRWTQEFWRCVLTPDEKEQGYYLKQDTSALLSGDFKSRMEGYSAALQNGVYCIDEAREKEDMDPVEGGDEHYVQLNLQPVSTAADPKPVAAPLRVPVKPAK